jgi:outer membrane lipoprotein-sorting protein
MKSLLIFIGLFSIPLFATTQLDTVVEKMEKRWNSAKTLRADVIQKVESKGLGLPPEETKGVITIAKPEKLRWEVASEGLIQILNGQKFTSLQKNSRGTNVVDIIEDVRQYSPPKALRFLTQEMHLKQVYLLKLLKKTPKTVSFSMKPKKGTAESYIAEVDKKDYFLTSLTTDSSDTKVVLKLSAVERNVALKKQLFTYQPGPTDFVHVNP